MNIQTKITSRILYLTGYRFPKYEGLFKRDSYSRKLLTKLGIKCVLANLSADSRELITQELGRF